MVLMSILKCFLQLQNDHEFELANINAWESELEVQKENLETQLNEINGYESAWQKIAVIKYQERVYVWRHWRRQIALKLNRKNNKNR